MKLGTVSFSYYASAVSRTRSNKTNTRTQSPRETEDKHILPSPQRDYNRLVYIHQRCAHVAFLLSNRPGIRRNFIGTARGCHHRCVNSAEGERDSSRGDVHGYVHCILAADPEHGGRARSFGKGHGKRGCSAAGCRIQVCQVYVANFRTFVCCTVVHSATKTKTTQASKQVR